MRYRYTKEYSWNSNMAYIVGLIASDGCLSKDGRHVDFTSNDFELVSLYRSIIKPNAKIGTKNRNINMAYRVQFSDVALYDFLVQAGLTPNKSHTIKQILVPSKYFWDFLRGVFDGDGCIYSVRDKRWKNSIMHYFTIACASKDFLLWLKLEINKRLPETTGSIRVASRAYVLTYAKRDTRSIFKQIYYNENLPSLSRKKQKYLEILSTDPYAIHC